MPVWAIDLDGAEPNLRHKGNGIYGVGLFDQFELGSIQCHDASLRIGKSGKQFQLQWLLNNNGQMVGYLASRVIPEGEYKSLYGGKGEGQLLRTIPIISRIEMQILTRALGILNSKEFQTLRDAHANGVTAEVKIGGTTVLYEPDFNYGEAMTLHQENGFLLRPRAFSAKGGVEHTVLWELTRLETQGTGSLGFDETRSNTNSAEATANKLLSLVKEQPQ